jgi:hypothetical protein
MGLLEGECYLYITNTVFNLTPLQIFYKSTQINFHQLKPKDEGNETSSHHFL